MSGVVLCIQNMIYSETCMFILHIKETEWKMTIESFLGMHIEL